MLILKVRHLSAIAGMAVLLAACDDPASAGHFPQFRPTPPPPSPPASIGGTYTMTLDAATNCSQLPDYARVHAYQASITQTEGSRSATVQLSDQDFQMRFDADVTATNVTFGIDVGGQSTCDMWFEKLQPTGFLNVCGTVNVEVGAKALVGTLQGTIGYVGEDGNYSAEKACRATHGIVFARK